MFRSKIDKFVLKTHHIKTHHHKFTKNTSGAQRAGCVLAKVYPSPYITTQASRVGLLKLGTSNIREDTLTSISLGVSYAGSCRNPRHPIDGRSGHEHAAHVTTDGRSAAGRGFARRNHVTTDGRAFHLRLVGRRLFSLSTRNCSAVGGVGV